MDDPLRVLLIEDVDTNRELAEYVFEREGFVTTSAVCGAQALDLLARECFDAIALDLQLPDMDGLEIARRIKASPEAKRVAVVAITARAMKGDREAALAAGCDDYITKPVNTRTLAKRLARTVAELRA